MASRGPSRKHVSARDGEGNMGSEEVKNLPWQDALDFLYKLVDTRISAGIATYSSAIAACSRSGKWDAAIFILLDMHARRMTPDVYSYTSAIAACDRGGGRGGLWEVALQLFAQIAASSSEATQVTYSSAISACGRARKWQVALTLLAEVLVSRCVLNQITYNCAISACEKSGQWQLALVILKDMQQTRADPDVISFNSTISACEKGNDWETALHLLACVHDAQLVPDQVSISSAISACEKCGQWQAALHLFNGASAAHTQPDIITFNSTISAAEKAAQWRVALDLLTLLFQSMALPNSISYGSAISACEKAGKWRLALSLFSQMPSVKASQNTICYSGAISACEKCGQWQMAGHLLAAMRTSEVEQDVITLNSTVSAFEKGGRWRLVFQMLEWMSRTWTRANKVTYSSAISACASGDSCWQTALGWLSCMCCAKSRPNEVSLNSAIAAVEKGGHWQAAAGILSRMTEHPLLPDGVSLCTGEALSPELQVAISDIAAELSLQGLSPGFLSEDSDIVEPHRSLRHSPRHRSRKGRKKGDRPMLPARALRGDSQNLESSPDESDGTPSASGGKSSRRLHRKKTKDLPEAGEGASDGSRAAGFESKGSSRNVDSPFHEPDSTPSGGKSSRRLHRKKTKDLPEASEGASDGSRAAGFESKGSSRNVDSPFHEPDSSLVWCTPSGGKSSRRLHRKKTKDLPEASQGASDGSRAAGFESKGSSRNVDSLFHEPDSTPSGGKSSRRLHRKKTKDLPEAGEGASDGSRAAGFESKGSSRNVDSPFHEPDSSLVWCSSRNVDSPLHEPDSGAGGDGDGKSTGQLLRRESNDLPEADGDASDDSRDSSRGTTSSSASGSYISDAFDELSPANQDKVRQFEEAFREVYHQRLLAATSEEKSHQANLLDSAFKEMRQSLIDSLTTSPRFDQYEEEGFITVDDLTERDVDALGELVNTDGPSRTPQRRVTTDVNMDSPLAGKEGDFGMASASEASDFESEDDGGEEGFVGGRQPARELVTDVSHLLQSPQAVSLGRGPAVTRRQQGHPRGRRRLEPLLLPWTPQDPVHLRLGQTLHPVGHLGEEKRFRSYQVMAPLSFETEMQRAALVNQVPARASSSSKLSEPTPSRTGTPVPPEELELQRRSIEEVMLPRALSRPSSASSTVQAAGRFVGLEARSASSQGCLLSMSMNADDPLAGEAEEPGAEPSEAAGPSVEAEEEIGSGRAGPSRPRPPSAASTNRPLSAALPSKFPDGWRLVAPPPEQRESQADLSMQASSCGVGASAQAQAEEYLDVPLDETLLRPAAPRWVRTAVERDLSACGSALSVSTELPEVSPDSAAGDLSAFAVEQSPTFPESTPLSWSLWDGPPTSDQLFPARPPMPSARPSSRGEANSEANSELKARGRRCTPEVTETLHLPAISAQACPANLERDAPPAARGRHAGTATPEIGQRWHTAGSPQSLRVSRSGSPGERSDGKTPATPRTSSAHGSAVRLRSRPPSSSRAGSRSPCGAMERRVQVSDFVHTAASVQRCVVDDARTRQAASSLLAGFKEARAWDQRPSSEQAASVASAATAAQRKLLKQLKAQMKGPRVRVQAKPRSKVNNIDESSVSAWHNIKHLLAKAGADSTVEYGAVLSKGFAEKLNPETGNLVTSDKGPPCSLLFDLDSLVLTADGGFRRPGEDQPLFPLGNFTLKWRWDPSASKLIIDFWKDMKLLEWRWDELVPSKDLRFPSLVADWSGTGHVGSSSFSYSMLSLVAENFQQAEQAGKHAQRLDSGEGALSMDGMDTKTLAFMRAIGFRKGGDRNTFIFIHASSEKRQQDQQIGSQLCAASATAGHAPKEDEGAGCTDVCEVLAPLGTLAARYGLPPKEAMDFYKDKPGIRLSDFLDAPIHGAPDAEETQVAKMDPRFVAPPVGTRGGAPIEAETRGVRVDEVVEGTQVPMDMPTHESSEEGSVRPEAEKKIPVSTPEKPKKLAGKENRQQVSRKIDLEVPAKVGTRRGMVPKQMAVKKKVSATPKKTPRVEQRNCNKRKPQLRKVDVDLGCETPPQEILGHDEAGYCQFNMPQQVGAPPAEQVGMPSELTMFMQAVAMSRSLRA
eukprot:s451_g9.t2